MSATIDFAALFEANPNAFALLTPDLTVAAANQAFREMTSRSETGLIGQRLFDTFPADATHPANAAKSLLQASFARVLDTRCPDKIDLLAYPIAPTAANRPATEERYWNINNVPILNKTGAVELILQHVVDITAFESFKRSNGAADDGGFGRLSPIEGNVFLEAQIVREANVRIEEERGRLRSLFEQAPGFVAFLAGPLHRFELVNAAYYQLVGYRDIVGKTLLEALPEVEGQGFPELLNNVFATGKSFVGRGLSVALQREPGVPLETRLVDFVYQPVPGSDGTVTGVFCQGHDVTDQKRAQDELAQHRVELEKLVAERTRQLEESQVSLLHARKLEAIGKLTGGVAHDFNNVLQIISGNLHLLQSTVGANPGARKRIDSAIGAVERGAKLSSQLLAFARRQPLRPVVTNLRQVVYNFDNLVRQTLGDAIQFETTVAPGLWNTQVDPGQLENVILNLVINARDAMGGSGKLTMSLANAVLDESYAKSQPDVVTGQYVLLAISDTGCGMTPDVLERAFEPFFTTKGEGEGTGLGLSTAYGFVRQSGGHIRIDSAPGRGTTLNIYLPRSLQPAAELAPSATNSVIGGDEAVLVVEDDAEVRNVVTEMLAAFGYQVLTAADAESAMAVVESGIHIDLIFTDVVMPGPTTSVEMARQAKAILPDVEILFTSGYTQDAIVHGGRQDEGVTLLSKPYGREDLARKIRQLLGAKRRAAEVRTNPVVPASPVPSSNTRKIMVVEDNDVFRHLLSAMLAVWGHSVVSESNGEQALEAMARDSVDVLIADINLPGISGIELARRVRAEMPNVSIVFSSGIGESVTGTLDIDAPILSKPYSVHQLQEVLLGISHWG